MRLLLPEEPPPGVTVATHGPMLLPANRDGWILQLLGEGASVQGEPEDFTTVHGWEAALVRARVPGGARAVACYRLLHLYAALVIDAPDMAALDAHPEELRRFLSAVQPDFATDEVVALEELWQ